MKPKGVPKTLPIESLLLVPALQMREDQDSGHITDLAEALKEKKKLPRVQVMHVAEGEQTGYFVTDGFHTTLANQRAGNKRVACLVSKGTWEDAIIAATAANKVHLGLKRTRGDKRRAVNVILAQFGKKWTDGRIAEHIGVSPTFVRSTRLGVRAEQPGEPETEEPVTREGADGKKYTTKKRAKPKPSPDSEPEEAKPEVVELPTYRDFEAAIGQAGRMIETIAKAKAGEKQSAEYRDARETTNNLMKTVKDWLARLGK